MKNLRLAAMLLATSLAACTTGTDGTVTLTPGGRGFIQIACTFDKLAPGGIATVGAIVQLDNPGVADQIALVNQNDRLVHPLVQAACDAVPGQPAPLVVAAPGTAAPMPGTPIMLPAAAPAS